MFQTTNQYILFTLPKRNGSRGVGGVRMRLGQKVRGPGLTARVTQVLEDGQGLKDPRCGQGPKEWGKRRKNLGKLGKT